MSQSHQERFFATRVFHCDVGLMIIKDSIEFGVMPLKSALCL